MKSKFYFFLASILIKLTNWFKVLSIESDIYRMTFEERAIYYSQLYSAKKIIRMRKINRMKKLEVPARNRHNDCRK